MTERRDAVFGTDAGNVTGAVCMKVCVLQMNVVKGNREANRNTVRRMTEQAVSASCPPDVLVLPELWSTGYELEKARELSSPMGEDDAAFLASLAREYHVAFAGGSVLSERDGAVHNRAQVIERDGRYVTGYDKVHLFRLMDEHRYLTPGRERCLFDMGGMRCALAVCYDIRFCEFIRALAVNGAEVLFVGAEWPATRREHWETLLRARAVENEMYVVACNRCGTSGTETFAGSSMIIAPDGTVLAHAGEKEEIAGAEIELSAVRRMRETIPVFLDRVPELY